MSRHFAAKASLYMAQRLATGEFERECCPEKLDHFITVH